jgi:hypothetical protein
MGTVYSHGCINIAPRCFIHAGKDTASFADIKDQKKKKKKKKKGAC